MNILIVDFHAGCIASAALTFLKMGHEITVVSLSRHTHLLHDLGLGLNVASGDLENRLLKRMGIRKQDLPKKIVRSRHGVFPRRMMGGVEYDLAFVFFPPGLYRRVLNSGIARKVVVVASHRFDMWFATARSRAKFHNEIAKDQALGRIQLVASNEFDAKYIEHYLDLKVEVIPPSFPYLSDSMICPTKISELALVGPANVRPSVQTFMQNLKLPEKDTPKSIRALYGNYKFDDLRNHYKIVVFPYSIYSISLSELAALGYLMFVPTDRWLQETRILDDVQLFPLYGKEKSIANQKSFRNKDGDPNIGVLSIDWIRYASWRDFPNVRYWDSISELEKLISTEYGSEEVQKFKDQAVRWNQQINSHWDAYLRKLNKDIE
jgi:hypothetical protein